MKKLLAACTLAATALALPACSGKDAADNAATNDAALANDDFISGQENLTDETVANAVADNVVVDGAADLSADAPANAAAGNAL